MARERLTPSHEAVDKLLEALEMLRVFTEPDNTKCSLPADIRERARGYLITWVEGPMTSALRSISPEFHQREMDLETEETGGI